MERIVVPIDKEISKFEHFLDDKSNHRILFSGNFGSGKTYFLNEFFKRKTDKYEAFYISPVNYSISKNEDVLKLLQYDLLLELLLKGLLPQSNEHFSKKEIMSFFFYYNWPLIIKDAVSFCGKIGKKVSDAYDKFSEWVKKYNEFSTNVNEFQEDKTKKEIIDRAKELDCNLHTELIDNIVSNIEKETVLIIDDLDRIDPEHIFRLLNVFSAQLSDYFSSHSFAENEKNNKFGFNKVIFVCDIDNIRNIFHAKYGQDTDFSGYIDKFYSTAPYIWSNKEMLLKAVSLYVDSVRSELDKAEQRNLLRPTMRMLVHYNVINLRKFVEKEQQEWIWPYRKYSILNGNDNVNPYAVEIVDFVLFMFGTAQDAISVLKPHTEEFEMKTDFKVLDNLLPFLDEKNYKNGKEGELAKYTNKDLNIIIEYKISNCMTEKCTLISKTTDLEGREKKKIPFFQLLSIAIENYCLLVKGGEIYRY